LKVLVTDLLTKQGNVITAQLYGWNQSLEEREWEGDGLVSEEIGCPCCSKLQLLINPFHCTHEISHLKKY
jgi:hypothetical protein